LLLQEAKERERKDKQQLKALGEVHPSQPFSGTCANPTSPRCSCCLL